MKSISWIERANVRSTDLLKQRIAFLSEKGFLWREIAELTDLPKKLIKGIAKGEYFPNEDEFTRIYDILDTTIDRLTDDAAKNDTSASPKQGSTFEGLQSFKVEVKSVSIYKGTDDDKMVIKIEGVKLNN